MTAVSASPFRAFAHYLTRGLHALCALSGLVAITAHAIAGQPGTLDATFGLSSQIAGTVVTPMRAESNDAGRAVAVQPDGKIVVGGSCSGTVTPFTQVFCVARYLSDGSLDMSFGNAGKVLIAFDTTFAGASTRVSAVAIQTDGKIVLSGSCDQKVVVGVVLSPSRFCALRLTPSGVIDTSFATAGKLMMSVVAPPSPLQTSYYGDLSTSMLAQADGKIVVSGDCAVTGSTPGKFCVLRLNTNGSPDTTFGIAGDGKLVTDILNVSYSLSQATALTLQPDGKLVVAGNCATNLISPPLRGFCTLRVHGGSVPGLKGGTLDATYGFNGRSAIEVGALSGVATGVVVQPDGKIALGGWCTRVGSSLKDACAGRLLANGSPDPTFGANGAVVLTTAESVFMNALALQPDGKLLLTGYCNNDQVPQFCVKRLYDNGTLDTTFNGNGTVRTGISPYHVESYDIAFAMALQLDGKIVVAGVCKEGGTPTNDENFCVARYDAGPFAARVCSVDIDGDGRFLATTDGLIFNRVGLGVIGDAVVAGISFAPEATRTTWTLIRNYLVTQCGMSLVP